MRSAHTGSRASIGLASRIDSARENKWDRAARSSFGMHDARSVADSLAEMVASGKLDLPLPGHGCTLARFAALSEIAATDLSLARLAEGHADAVAILAEAGLAPHEGSYGVWAADFPDARVYASRGAGWTLHGRKKYCSGAHGLDRALITAHTEDGIRLFDVDLAADGVYPVPDTWLAVGMAATESLDVVLEDVKVNAVDEVGAPGYYLARPGFWFGAVGVAACWYGGALGAFRMLRAHLSRIPMNDHQAAHLGAVAASCATMKTTLDAAAGQIDADPADEDRSGQKRALVVRHIVEQGCQEVLTRVGRAGGTTPLAFDADHARRAADLLVYLRQHHAERDLAALGRLMLEAHS
jgi:alkylation response protein AidB-like acyl-CoA dehydrogenase